jgi:hypothetical protein
MPRNCFNLSPSLLRPIDIPPHGPDHASRAAKKMGTHALTLEE